MLSHFCSYGHYNYKISAFLMLALNLKPDFGVPALVLAPKKCSIVAPCYPHPALESCSMGVCISFWPAL